MTCLMASITCSLYEAEVMSQPDQRRSIKPCEPVVGHHAQAAVQVFEFANRIGLKDVEQTKQYKSQEDAKRRRRHRNRHQGDELPADFIHDNLTGVVNAGGSANAARSPHPKHETDEAEPYK